MRVTEISVQNLFGVFNHVIPLNRADRITIIHGPNGFGKTILLKMLSGLFNNHYTELRTVPFEKFQVKFDDNSLVWVEKTVLISRVRQQPLLTEDASTQEEIPSQYSETTIYFSTPALPEPQAFSLKPLSDQYSRRELAFIATFMSEMPGFTQIGAAKWLHIPSDEVLSVEGVIERFGHLLPAFPQKEPDWLLEVQKSIDIHFIETQRLLNIREINAHQRGSRVTPVVKSYANNLAKTIKEKAVESADLSQSLDRTFPSRLMEQMGNASLTVEELRDKLNELERKRTRLHDVGLLDKAEDMRFLPTQRIADSTRDVLSVYARDVEKKLSIYDDIAAKIKLFKEIINKRFLYKQIVISKEKGFEMITDGGTTLPLTALSSGEQHELVILYELLFKVKPDALILIDEPELSLHVAWQKEFLKDLQAITRLASFDVLIATHSPQIIHNRWDLTVELKGPESS